MKSVITLDSELNMETPQFVQIIVKFRTPPAHLLMMPPQNMSEEEANARVNRSHEDFKKELLFLLGENGFSYTILHSYTTSLNGVAMELQGIAIRQLLSSEGIQGIYPNREMRVPENPLM